MERVSKIGWIEIRGQPRTLRHFEHRRLAIHLPSFRGIPGLPRMRRNLAVPPCLVLSFLRKTLHVVPTFAQISPLRIHCFYQSILLLSSPCLDFFFPCNGFSDVGKQLVVDQAMALIFLRETIPNVILVLKHALSQIIRNAGIKCPP